MDFSRKKNKNTFLPLRNEWKLQGRGGWRAYRVRRRRKKQEIDFTPSLTTRWRSVRSVPRVPNVAEDWDRETEEEYFQGNTLKIFKWFKNSLKLLALILNLWFISRIRTGQIFHLSALDSSSGHFRGRTRKILLFPTFFTELRRKEKDTERDGEIKSDSAEAKHSEPCQIQPIRRQTSQIAITKVT